jgi:hypothetical protein
MAIQRVKELRRRRKRRKERLKARSREALQKRQKDAGKPGPARIPRPRAASKKGAAKVAEEPASEG